MSKFYPVYLDIRGKMCVIVGGGKVAFRKACSLQDAGANVVVVSPDICGELEKQQGLTVVKKRYEEPLIDNAFLVIAATDNEEVNRKVAADAEKRNIMVNVADSPELCSFTVPATIKRGDLCISISTGGASPAFAKNIRREVEDLFGPEYEVYVNLLAKMRTLALSNVKDESKRRKILQQFAEKHFLETVKTKGVEKAEAEMRKVIFE
ncbi:MAG: bifunctional precorrin-2 dehydrogenase/sirohydrochlorin ferrochelatase [Candidatus Scalindua sp. AMX11]|nr:MAG: bifunctional precorrin-2 dehydrogenase/sirohydrochlorin ferrochelatase [Candidatus Scalindua sp.]NOG85056.1 bifunctional precorrin-2 dehydrogenase/sirohydrochlorin ferrochelatase [Planctomycetota bacterium]RZV93104.1 MAG: bifunctional precorrin-2 dehydrogenase/sirohydrochlorin ferrochelatase [Candidatus Scalindua sp. SCAELEC01]TDE66730.1 MAG: bifunctional precorrin-2 dehydrogenase/sirohydrochlorin ferrochelatase [Candidatus Scalindua sp. AMX11]GJQ58041.1 MAG: precorrin-2 oxidase [Candid